MIFTRDSCFVKKGKKIFEKKLTSGSFKTFPEDDTLFEFSISGEISLLVYAASVKERDKWKEEVMRKNIGLSNC